MITHETYDNVNDAHKNLVQNLQLIVIVTVEECVYSIFIYMCDQTNVDSREILCSACVKSGTCSYSWSLSHCE